MAIALKKISENSTTQRKCISPLAWIVVYAPPRLRVVGSRPNSDTDYLHNLRKVLEFFLPWVHIRKLVMMPAFDLRVLYVVL